jgi:hypothetical protein
MMNTLLYTIDTIKDEACQLVRQGLVNRHQPIYTLCRYFPMRDWEGIECELERYDYLLRDRIGDLLAQECWSDD